jgi:hypothetical protein
MNIRLLREIQADVLAAPERYNMGVYLGFKPIEGGGWCGTIGCIAGSAVMKSLPDVEVESFSHLGSALCLKNGTVVDVHAEARKLLGLTREQASELFLGYSARDAIPGTRAYAQAVSDHIDKFIKKHNAL